MHRTLPADWPDSVYMYLASYERHLAVVHYHKLTHTHTKTTYKRAGDLFASYFVSNLLPNWKAG